MKKSGRFVFYNDTKVVLAEFPLFSVAKLSKLKARARRSAKSRHFHGLFTK